MVDINLDGADDIAVGAPALVNAGDDPLYYFGSTMIYFGQPAKRCVARGAANITIACTTRYCNIGFSLTAGDMDMDGHSDLVIGSPFYGANNDTKEQQGFVGTLLASKMNTGYQYLTLDQLSFGTTGDQNYSWFGYDVTAVKWYNMSAVLVNQPEYRKCFFKNCTFSASDVQAIGQLRSYSRSPLLFNLELQGNDNFSQLGWASDLGTPYTDQTVGVLAVTEIGASVAGSVAGVDVTFDQTGRVRLYNISHDAPPTLTPHKLEGDRAFERFGSIVKFLDLNNDGMSDLVVGAPHWSNDITEELLLGDQGMVYIYTGGKDFPFVPSMADCGNSLVHPCPRLQASYLLQWTQQKPRTRFGSNFGLLNGSTMNQLFVTAEHASEGARMSGGVGVFNFKHSNARA